MPVSPTLARLLLAALALLATSALSACGEKDAADESVAWLERSFRNGDIKESLSAGERLAFSRTDGLRRRGSHVVEGLGVQYRFVRVEAVEPVVADLEEDDGAGNKRKRVSEELFKKVKDGEIARVAEVTVEIVPNREWLEQHAVDMIVAGAGANVSPFIHRYTMLHDGENWVMTRGAAQGDARRLLGLYRQDDKLDGKIIKRELAERLITEPPEDEQEEG